MHEERSYAQLVFILLIGVPFFFPSIAQKTVCNYSRHGLVVITLNWIEFSFTDFCRDLKSWFWSVDFGGLGLLEKVIKSFLFPFNGWIKKIIWNYLIPVKQNLAAGGHWLKYRLAFFTKSFVFYSNYWRVGKNSTHWKLGGLFSRPTFFSIGPKRCPPAHETFRFFTVSRSYECRLVYVGLFLCVRIGQVTTSVTPNISTCQVFRVNTSAFDACYTCTFWEQEVWYGS